MINTPFINVYQDNTDTSNMSVTTPTPYLHMWYQYRYSFTHKQSSFSTKAPPFSNIDKQSSLQDPNFKPKRYVHT